MERVGTWLRPRQDDDPAIVRLGVGLVVGVAMFLTARFGIWSRSAFDLAVVWPANALLLGLLVRWPRCRHVATVAAGTAGLLAADLSTGGAVGKTLWLTAGNLTGVAVGALLLLSRSRDEQRLASPQGVVWCSIAAIGGGFGAAVTGLYSGPEYFDLNWSESLRMWFTNEVAMYLSFLPVILTWPERRLTQRRIGDHRRELLEHATERLVPWLVVAGAVGVGIAVGGPAALTFPLPALMWLALRGRIFETACALVLTNLVQLVTLKWAWLDLDYQHLRSSSQISLQVCLAMAAVGPLMVAASAASQQRLLHAFERLASHDVLTGLLSRRALEARADLLVRTAGATDQRVAVFMIDLDRFKTVNDRFGHIEGDRVLVAAAAAIEASVRSSDLVGRIGGDEFVLVSAGLPVDACVAVGERIREGIATAGLTASIGITVAPADRHSFGDLRSAADSALYDAKRSGGDRVVLGPAGDASSTRPDADPMNASFDQDGAPPASSPRAPTTEPTGRIR